GPTIRIYSERKIAMNAVRSMIVQNSLESLFCGQAVREQLIAAHPGFPKALRPIRSAAVFHDLVEHFRCIGQVKLDFGLLAVATQPKAQRVAGFLVAQPAVQPARRLLFVPQRDNVADAESGCSGSGFRLYT